jgi:hypothetical protein
MGRAVFCNTEVSDASFSEAPSDVSFSSSELLTRFRVPRRGGEGGALVDSTRADLGRYLGRAEALPRVRGRSVDLPRWYGRTKWSTCFGSGAQGGRGGVLGSGASTRSASNCFRRREGVPLRERSLPYGTATASGLIRGGRYGASLANGVRVVPLVFGCAIARGILRVFIHDVCKCLTKDVERITSGSPSSSRLGRACTRFIRHDGRFNGVVWGEEMKVLRHTVEFAYNCLAMLGRRVASRFLTSYVVRKHPSEGLELPHEPNRPFPFFVQEHIHSAPR